MVYPDIGSLPELSVSQLSEVLKRTVEMAFSRVRVKGEISGFKRHSSGHLYFTLKDEQAVLDAVCWRGTAYGTIQPEEGMAVIATGKLTIYPGRSKYQIVIEALEPAGEGALLKLLEERKKKLAAEGLFDAERKRSLPFLPKLIGIVTSPTGAVIRDIIHRLEDRFPCHVVVWPVAVQGEGAYIQIARAIRGFNNLETHKPDLLIVARGGGSLEDLWAFNEEDVVRAVAESQIPIISAVGHETDITLIDFAADKRAPTPTAAAEFAVPVRHDLLETITSHFSRIRSYIENQFQLQNATLEALRRGLPNLISSLENQLQRLDDWRERFVKAQELFWEQKQEALLFLFTQLKSPQHLIEVNSLAVPMLGERLALAYKNYATTWEKNVMATSQLLESYAVDRTLERGFLLAFDAQHHIVKSITDIEEGQDLTLQFKDGKIITKTTKKI